MDWYIFTGKYFYFFQHGLYTDCTRAERFTRPPMGASTSSQQPGWNGDLRRYGPIYDKSPLQCTYKFDSSAAQNLEHQVRDLDANAASAEAEHHQFLGM